ncbi:acetate--CoA ligase family protein [Bordetella sp. BOR01]|uniref:acetate--CoA ligase family protein n=1 Tax=Bordetella sp. BOR01 TaxID=2854779 RepID=UPI001C48B720|nr:acetate--CoA ligase family protein [Bordetella sp. BOR01]MBV7486613.1 acetate--CoA ligase family protein [Bordetella sp. BOR01]
MRQLDRLLRPRSVAVIGASSDAAKTAGRPIAYLQKHGYTGRIYPVNPRNDTIAGLPCYSDIAALPDAPDVGLVLLGASRAVQAVGELAQRGAGAAIVLASGFQETGAAGAGRQQALREAAGSMPLLGPNTIGLVNLTDGITLSATGALEMDDLRTGSIAVVSQSGGVLGAMLSRAASRGIGFSKLVSTGNEADLDVADFIDILLDDPATSVIALYIEGLRKPAAFRAAAQRAAQLGKPLVAFKVGRSESGARSAVSHTGALAGADRLYDALFAQCGVIRAQTFADLLDIPAALCTGRRLAGKRIAILTSTGGAGTLVADSCGLAGLDTPAPDADTAARLDALQSGDEAVLSRNPIDLTLAGLKPDLLRGAIDTLLASPSYDGAVVVAGSSSLQHPTLVSSAVGDCLKKSGKPVLVYVSPHAPHILADLNRQGIPAFAAPESCAAAFSAMLAQEAAAQAQPAATPQAVRDDARALPAGPLNEADSKALFASFGIASVRETVAATSAAAAAAAPALGDRVVLKVLSRHLAHKSDIGGVAVGVPAADVAARGQAMLQTVQAATAAPLEGLLVQEMVAGGTEMILGFHRDPQLGPSILLGMGGVAAELFNDTELRLLPLTRADAEDMVRSLKTWPLLDGYRGRPRADVPALVDAIMAFATMAAELDAQLDEAEINPLFVMPAGQGVKAADGVVIVR